MAYLIETADRQQNILMISSIPIILGSLRNIFPQSHHDLTPIASVVVNYGANLHGKKFPAIEETIPENTNCHRCPEP